MNNSDPSSKTPARGILKLKVAARVQPRASAPAPRTAISQNDKVKPGARWDDVHKERMQAEMDAFAR